MTRRNSGNWRRGMNSKPHACAMPTARWRARWAPRRRPTSWSWIEAGTVTYHGAIDDQYGLGYARDTARRRYLVDALESLLAGRRPEIQATAAPGCALDLERAAPQPAGDAVSYHNRISRIVQAYCVECHRAEGLAPFPLSTYEEVVAPQGHDPAGGRAGRDAALVRRAGRRGRAVQVEQRPFAGDGRPRRFARVARGRACPKGTSAKRRSRVVRPASGRSENPI